MSVTVLFCGGCLSDRSLDCVKNNMRLKTPPVTAGKLSVGRLFRGRHKKGSNEIRSNHVIKTFQRKVLPQPSRMLAIQFSVSR